MSKRSGQDRQRLWEEQRKIDIRWQMSHQAGRRIMYDLIFGAPGYGGCDLLNTYTAQDSGIYRHEGRREVGAERAAELQSVCPDLYAQMFSERVLQQKNDKLTQEAEATAEREEIEHG